MENIRDRIEKLKSKIGYKNPSDLSNIKEDKTNIIIAEFISPVIVGAMLGKFIDDSFNLFPLCMISMFFLGFLSGFYNIYKIGKNKDN